MIEDTEAIVCQEILKRQQLGIGKYRTTVARNPLNLRDWLEHQYLELLDAAIYCRRAMQEMDEALNRAVRHAMDEDEPE